jgi:hypothetical protein
VQTSGQEIITQMTKELDSQTQVVRHPEFRRVSARDLIGTFHPLFRFQNPRYKWAALAFDEQIAHRVRPYAAILQR